MSDGKKYILKFVANKKDSNYVVRDVSSKIQLPDYDERENGDYKDPEFIFDNHFDKEFRDRLKVFALAMDKDICRKFENPQIINVYFQNYDESYGYFYSLVINYCDSYLFQRPFENKNLDKIDFDNIDDCDFCSESSEELDLKPTETNYEDEDAELEETFTITLPKVLPKPIIPVTEFEKLIGFVAKQSHIQYLKKSDEKTEDNFREKRNPILREGLKQFCHKKGVIVDGKSHEITVIDFARC